MSDNMRDVTEYNLTCPECGGQYLYIHAMVYEGCYYDGGSIEPDYDLSGGKNYYVDPTCWVVCRSETADGGDCEYEGELSEFNVSRGIGGMTYPREAGDPPEA